MKIKRVKTDKKTQASEKSSATLFAFVAFAAITSVLILGYLRFSDSGKAIVAVKTIHIDSAKEKIKQEMQAKLPVIRKEMYHPSENSLKGRWFAKIGKEGIAEITLDGKNFELIYVQSPRSVTRKFSKGVYKYNTLSGVLELQPRRGEEPSLQSKGVRYKILTMRKFQIVILKKKDNPILYFSAQEHDVPAKTYHPIFLYDDYAGAPVLEFMPVNMATVSGAGSNKTPKASAVKSPANQ